MQLDQTLIAVRERTLADIQDLSLYVLRSYFRPLFGAFLVVALPLACLNGYLIDWMLFHRPEDDSPPIRYFFAMIFLVTTEAQLASVASTMYLGLVVFRSEPRFSTMFRDLLRMFGALLWSHGVLRCVVPIILAYAFMVQPRAHGPDTPELAAVVPLLILALVVRSMRPFITEIIVLERCRSTAHSAAVMTIGRRSAALHNPTGSDLFGRWIQTSVVAMLLAGSAVLSLLYAWGMLSNQWEADLFAARILYPLGLWLVAFYVSVVRYLSYLDARIRQEGWEVELRVRAEAARLLRTV